jgi:LCP family protein required for cell wall assembly
MHNRKKSHTKKYFLLAIFFVAIAWALWIVFHPGSVATKIIFHQNPQLQQTNGRTNILLLGTGGANHDGPNLTDTIIFASVDEKKNEMDMISIPRDLWVVNGDTSEKINEAYADGQANNSKGLVYAKAVVSKVLGQPIHYAFRIDFGGFVKAVDVVGGIDVTVDNTLDDLHYPIDGKEDESCGHSDEDIKSFVATASAEQLLWDFFPCRYKHLHVDPGVIHMDGIAALEFVRSRHAAGSEGSDFARSRRQQRVIEAFRGKVLSLGILLNPSKLFELYNVIKTSIDTDISQEDLTQFIGLAQKMKTAKIQTAVLDHGDPLANKAGLLIDTYVSTSYGNVFTLQPRVGDQDFSEIQQFVHCELTHAVCVIPTTPISPTPIGVK